MAVYVISDLHLGHFNILKYEPCRIEAIKEWIKTKDFYSPAVNYDKFIAECMELATDWHKQCLMEWHNEMLKDYWNSVVKPQDEVWFLGDLALYSKEYTIDFCNQLNGIKHMIYGNHDHWSAEVYKRCGFVDVSKKPVDTDKYRFSHAPLPAHDKINYYGHVHSKGSEISHKNDVCACVEVIGFKPLLIEK